MTAVATGKADATLKDQGTLKALLAANPTMAPLGESVFSSPLASAFRKGHPEVRVQFNDFLKKIRANGVYDDAVRSSFAMLAKLKPARFGKTEDHELKNGVHFADYIRRVDVPGSKFAFALRSQQVRYLSVSPKRPDATLKTVSAVVSSRSFFTMSATTPSTQPRKMPGTGPISDTMTFFQPGTL